MTESRIGLVRNAPWYVRKTLHEVKGALYTSEHWLDFNRKVIEKNKTLFNLPNYHAESIYDVPPPVGV